MVFPQKHPLKSVWKFAGTQRPEGQPIPVDVTSRFSGFTLIELSIVLVIIAIIAGSVLSIGTYQTETAKIEQTQEKLKAVQEALAAYVMINGALPCPADGELAETNASYALADCTAGTQIAAENMYVGVVPARTLELPDEFVLDGWGKRITYAVHEDFTTPANFAAPPSGSFLTVETITAAQQRTEQAAYILLSHGHNGYGAWLRNGQAARHNIGLLGARESENSHDPTVKLDHDKVFVQSNASSAFDDILAFQTKWQIVHLAGASIAGSVISGEICDVAARTLLPINTLPTPSEGAVGCEDESSPGDYNAQCIDRQVKLATQVNAFCF